MPRRANLYLYTEFIQHLERNLPLKKKVIASVTRLSWCVYFMTQSVKYLISIIFDMNYFAAKNLSEENLPPTHDALILHLSRVAFQVYIWINALTTLLDLPSPIDNGWILKDGKLEQHLMSQIPAPRKVARRTAKQIIVFVERVT